MLESGIGPFIAVTPETRPLHEALEEWGRAGDIKNFKAAGLLILLFPIGLLMAIFGPEPIASLGVFLGMSAFPLSLLACLAALLSIRLKIIKRFGLSPFFVISQIAAIIGKSRARVLDDRPSYDEMEFNELWPDPESARIALTVRKCCVDFAAFEDDKLFLPGDDFHLMCWNMADGDDSLDLVEAIERENGAKLPDAEWQAAFKPGGISFASLVEKLRKRRLGAL